MAVPEPTFLLGIIRLLWAPIAYARRALGKRFRRLQPRLSDTALHRFFPPNFGAVIKLQAPRSKVRAVLGDPTYEVEQRWSYVYREAVLQLHFRDDGGSLETIIVGFVGDPKSDSVPLSWLDYPLGKLMLAHAAEHVSGGLDALEFQDGMRVAGLVLRDRQGPPGAWQYLSFGALQPLIGGLAETQFEWDRDAEALTSDPSTVLINWVAISGSSFENSWFDYTVTIPSH